MSDNGRPATEQLIAQRMDPARVQQLEQAAAQLNQLAVNRSLGELSNLANALQFVTEQANSGNPVARQLLTLLFGNLDTARAASAGIITPVKP